MNERGALEHRRSLLAGLRGKVIEIGVGEGSSFALYPPAVTHVLALEPEDSLRSIAVSKAASAPVPVTVLAAAAEKIPARDASVDAVVVSLVLCSVADQAAALAEIRRVLRPGGTLAFYEHVRSHYALVAGLQDLVTPLWKRIAGGCHPNRDTLGAMVAAGFAIEESKRFGFSAQRLSPKTAHILGTAKRPENPH